MQKQLPCTGAQLQLAKKANPSTTINNLVKCCFKNIDFGDMCYEKLYAMNPVLLDNIHGEFHFLINMKIPSYVTLPLLCFQNMLVMYTHRQT